MKQNSCKRCGAPLEFDSNYCRFCGQEINPPNSPHETPHADYNFVHEPDSYEPSMATSVKLEQAFWWCLSTLFLICALCMVIAYPTFEMKLAARLVILGFLILGLGICPAIVDWLEGDPSLQTVARLRVPLMFIAMVAFLVRIIYVNF